MMTMIIEESRTLQEIGMAKVLDEAERQWRTLVTNLTINLY